MSDHTAKRSRLSIEDVPSVEAMLSVDEVLMVIDNEESQLGSDDEFEDITYLEKERDEYGAIEPHLVTNSAPILPPPSPIPSQASTPTPPPQAPIPTSLPHAPTPTSLPHAATPTSLPHAPTPTTSPIPVRQTRVTSAGGSNDWSTILSPIDVAPFNQPVGPTVAHQHLQERC